MSDPAAVESIRTRPRIRWWPAVLIVVGAAVGVVLIWTTPITRDVRQSRILGSGSILLGGLALLVAWLLLASRLPVRTRIGFAAVVGLLVATAVGLFRIEGVSGDVLPVLAYRWQRSPAESVVPAEPAESQIDVDLLTTTPDDYPQFLGPRRKPEIDTVRLDPDWAAHPPEQLWHKPIGQGWGSFAIVGPYAVTQEQRGTDEQIVCYEARTGKTMWRYGYPAEFRKVIAGDGPRATPTIDEGRVYAMGATGILTCLDGRRGEKLWSLDVLLQSGGPNPEWGKSCSPLVLGNKVIVSAGGPQGWSLVAYDKHTSEIVWRGGGEPSAYGSPTLVNLCGVPQILILSTRRVVAHDPGDGHVIWERDWGEGSNNIAQPIVVGDDQLFLSSGYGFGCILLQLSRDETGKFASKPVWPLNKNMKFKFTNGVVRDGFVYGLDDGVLACLDLATGKRRWKAGRYGHGQILLIGDLLLVQGEAGALHLVRPNPQRLEELGECQALSSKTWNNPALSGSLLLVRNDREAMAFELALEPTSSGKQTATSPGLSTAP